MFSLEITSKFKHKYLKLQIKNNIINNQSSVIGILRFNEMSVFESSTFYRQVFKLDFCFHGQ